MSNSHVRRIQALVLLALASSVLALSSAAQHVLVDPHPATLTVVDVQSGFGQILPHRVPVPDASGFPTATILDVRSLDDLIANVRPQNPVLPTVNWPASAVLPNGFAGNQFVIVRFDDELDVDSILSPDPALSIDSALTGAIRVVAVDGATGVTSPVLGRAFVGGKTYAGAPSGAPPALPLQEWLQIASGVLVANPAIDDDANGVPDGLGAPGTEAGTFFALATELASPNVFAFVADTDANLATHETFPAGAQISVLITTAVRSAHGARVARQARGAANVGADAVRPEVHFTAPSIAAPAVVPTPGSSNVDPRAVVRIEFREPLQPLSVGSLPDGRVPALSSAITLSFGPPGMTTLVPFTAEPMSAMNLFTWVLRPSYPFPGRTTSAACGVFDTIGVTIQPAQLVDLAGNANAITTTSSFSTGEGPALVNAPVTPDAIYVATVGPAASLRVLDLNGFGASTGNPTYDPTFQTFAEGDSNFPNDPNVKLQGSLLRPPLAPGLCTVNGGASGVFRFTLDSNSSADLARAPILLGASDVMLGHALDAVFRDGPAPFGCQSGGGNLCALDGLKQIGVVENGNVVLPQLPGVNPLPAASENLCSWAPHPNPPPLVFPPPCVSPWIAGQEPTSVDTPVANLLGPGDPFGNPNQGVPPSGLLTPEQNAHFQGPSLPAPTIASCSPFMIRQKIGHFLYAVDRARRELVVLDSNRMLPIDRIALSDPVSLAMSPNLNLLAVVSQAGGRVSFVDVDPASSTFHEVVHETLVGRGPRGIAWEPDDEDVLVCNEDDGSVSVISAASLQVRRVVTNLLTKPFEIAITPRQTTFGFQRGVYFAWIAQRDGSVAVFESGPTTIGYDDVIGLAQGVFSGIRAIQPDPIDLRGRVWIAHQGPIVAGQPGDLGLGAVSRLGIANAAVGAQSVPPGSTPQFRSMIVRPDLSVGEPAITGKPIEIAFDDLRNLGGLSNVATPFTAGVPLPSNGKGMTRDLGGTVVNTNEPRYLFLAVSPTSTGSGAIDVIRIDQGFTRTDTNPYQPGIQSVPCSGASIVADYFRQ